LGRKPRRRRRRSPKSVCSPGSVHPATHRVLGSSGKPGKQAKNCGEPHYNV
jgi:hypothetical protein